MAIDRNFIQRFPVLIYFLLTLLISWGGIFLVMGFDGIRGATEVPDTLMPLVYLATLLGPSIAGLAMTGLVDGKAGFRELKSRLLRWRIGIRWYGIAILTAPLLILSTLILLSQTSPDYVPAIISARAPWQLLFTGIIMGLSVGFFEELGWTGFALPLMRQRHTILTSGLLLGCFWGLWHLPLFLGSINSSGTVPPVLYLMVLLFTFLPAYRVLMVWGYAHTESLLLIILMHAPLAASQMVLIPAVLTGIQIVIYNLIFTVLLWSIVAAVFLGSRRQIPGRAGLRG